MNEGIHELTSPPHRINIHINIFLYDIMCSVFATLKARKRDAHHERPYFQSLSSSISISSRMSFTFSAAAIFAKWSSWTRSLLLRHRSLIALGLMPVSSARVACVIFLRSIRSPTLSLTFIYRHLLRKL